MAVDDIWGRPIRKKRKAMLRSNLGACSLAYKLKFKQKRQIPAVLHFREVLVLKHA